MNRKEHIDKAALEYAQTRSENRGIAYLTFKDVAETGFVLCGYRHPHIISVLPTNPYWLQRKFDEDGKEVIQKYDELLVKYGWQEDSLTRCETIQGFITNKGRFVNRKEAFQIALAAGQIDESAGVGGELFSEDLY